MSPRVGIFLVLGFLLFATGTFGRQLSPVLSAISFFCAGIAFVLAGLNRISAHDEPTQWLNNSFAGDQRRWRGWGFMIFGIASVALGAVELVAALRGS